jgi:beta-galactosidase
LSLLDVPYFGSSYYPPHHESHDWERDLDNMARFGLGAIRTAELLASWDRIEVGEHRYDFSWLDRIFDLAEERGIRIILGTGSCCPPIWMLSRYPDLQVVSRDGVPYPIATSWSWACKDHPGYLQEVERWISVLAERYGNRPELLAWQIDNEPGFPFIPRRGERMALYCYCHNTEAEFRGWLRDRYENLDALSEAWRWDPTNHRYSDWSQVRAPRSMPIEWGSVTAWLDWRTFIAERLAGFIGWQHGLLRQLTPSVPTSTNVFIWARHDPFGVMMGQDPWRLSKQVDAIGYDLYPGIEKRFSRDPGYVGMHLDYARSSAEAGGSELWLQELESGPINGWALGPEHATSADDVVRWNTDALGAGARIVLYQGFREWNCIPIHWGALADLKGRPTERLEAAGRVALAVRQEPALFLESDPVRGDVALLHDFTNAVVLQGMAAEGELLEAMAATYRAFQSAGYSVRFVSYAELEGLRAKLLVLPFTLVLPGKAGRSVEDFVSSGGHLLAFAKSAMLDDRGWYWNTRPGAGLDAVLGAEESSVEAVTETDLDVQASDNLPGWQPSRLQGRWHRQTFSTLTAQTIGTYPNGEAAMTVNEFGSGRAYALGTHIGGSEGDPAAASLLDAVARRAGATKLFEAPRDPDGHVRVVARLRRSGARSLVTVTSTSSQAVNLLARVEASSASDLLTGEAIKVDEGCLSISIPAHGSRLIVAEER